jgi:transposase
LLSEPVRWLLLLILTLPPDALGYASTGWTVSLLRDALARWLAVRVSDATVRRALDRSDLAWKRPRYVLRPDPDREKKTQDSPADHAAP